MMTETNKNKEIQEALDFIKSSELGTTMSPLWQEMSKDFSFNQSASLRDYSINREYDFERVTKFYYFSKKIKFFSKNWTRISNILLTLINKFERFYFSILSKIILGDFQAFQKYSFDIYPLEVYTEHQKKIDLYDSYQKYNEKNSIFFSHNNYKSFTYYFNLTKHIEIASFESKNILEIGSGLFNFGTILTKKLDSFNYFCVDLPDVAMRGYLSAQENVDQDVQLFLPHQLKEFNNSPAKKKIIFLIPSQLESLDIIIDLFVNHESFSEMNIETVNDYLRKVKEKMISGSYIFLVNRFSRLQSRDNMNFDYTNFTDYEMSGFDEICYKVEELRSFLPVQKDFPNIFFIGKRNSN